MPLYTALETLVKEGKVVKVGSEVELTEKQGERLGDKVEKVEVKDEFIPGAVYEETEFRGLSAEDQKKKVEELGGDLKEITNADARWDFVFEKQA